METIPVGIRDFTIPSVSQGDRGVLTFIEGNTHIPFDIKRVFWIYGVSTSPHIERGGHAHKECEQVIIAVNGSVFIEMDRLTFQLRHPAQGVYVPPGVVVKMYGFSEDCVLMVLCSHHFSEEDYVDTVENHVERR